MSADSVTRRQRTPVRMLRYAAIIIVIAVVALLPLLHRSVGTVLPGPLDSPGSLQALSMMLLIGALAMTLYLVVGVSGMLPLGHGLYFALSAYSTVLLCNYTGLSFLPAAVLAVLLSTLVSAIVNALALRSTGVAFSMITLAFAELLATAIARGYLRSGAEQGVILSFDKTPSFLQGLANTRNIFWLCLALTVVIYFVVWFAEKRTNIGRVWVAVRENELRTESIGFNVYGYKVAVTVLASFLASVCGVLYVIVNGGANPDISAVMYSLTLLLMVILGGRGVVWGALLGGVVYTYLNLRLPVFAAADSIKSLGWWARIPLSQPEFILGVLFVAIILVAPNGLAYGLQRLGSALRRLFGRRRPPEPGGHAQTEAASPLASVPSSGSGAA